MRPEYTLDYIADTTLSGSESWDASLALGRHIAGIMDADSIDGNNRHYWIEDAQDMICGVSEQPDLTGEVEVILHKGEGEWSVWPPRGYREMMLFPRRAGRYVGFHVGHAATAATLLEVVAPLNRSTEKLLGYGSTTSFTFTPPQREIMRRYDDDDLALNPRRVQVAAQIMRHIVTHDIPGRHSAFKTDAEEEAFADEHFPYQDLPITGGGGKTARRRAARPLR